MWLLGSFSAVTRKLSGCYAVAGLFRDGAQLRLLFSLSVFESVCFMSNCKCLSVPDGGHERGVD